MGLSFCPSHPHPIGLLSPFLAGKGGSSPQTLKKLSYSDPQFIEKESESQKIKTNCSIQHFCCARHWFSAFHID